MPPGHKAITYVQADVRVALTALLILSGGSHTRARNVKMLVRIWLLFTFLYAQTGGPYAWAVSGSIITITYDHV